MNKVMQSDALEELLTLDEVAEHLRVSRRSIHRLIAGGELHKVKVGGASRIFRSEVAKYLAGLRGGRMGTTS